MAQSYNGPGELREFTDFLLPLGEFAMMFPKVERHVTWAIESFTGASRWDGNELEGMIRNFSSRLKVLDVVARPHCKTPADHDTRGDIVSRLKTLNALRNRLLHLSAVGLKYELNPDLTLNRSTLAMMLKELDSNTGKERNIDVRLTDLQQRPHEMATLIQDIRVWVHRLCPNAERHVP